jgi:hypothetical protein
MGLPGRIGTVFGAATDALLLTVSSASANEESDLATEAYAPQGLYWACNNAKPNGVGCFANDGEWFELYDTAADGHSVVMEWAPGDLA